VKGKGRLYRREGSRAAGVIVTPLALPPNNLIQVVAIDG